MRRHLISGALLAVTAVIAYHFAYRDQGPTVVPPAGTAAAPPMASHDSHLLPSRVPTHAIKLAGADDRREIEDRIVAAHTARTAHSAPAAPKLPVSADTPGSGAPEDTHDHDLERLSPKAIDALREVIPFLADCYRTADRTRDGGVATTAAAFVTLRGDPDVGTLIDADQLLDANHQPLAPELGGCLKSTLESLELPPVAEGDTIKLQYSFVFDDKHP